MGETLAQFDVMEDTPRMSPSNGPSLPVFTNTSRSGCVTEELTMGQVNVAVDEEKNS